jgi:hypothetical protein
MTNLFDSYLLKSGMPKEELCVIGRAKRTFYYYGMTILGLAGLSLVVSGLVNILA